MQHRLIHKLALAGASALAAALSSGHAAACGGFFCSQAQPVNQAAERIIFADNGDGTITAVIEIQYEGPSENFSWLLPIGSVPEGDQIGVASNLAFSRLQAATNPQFNLSTRVEGTCRRESSRGFDSAAESVVPTGSPGFASPILPEAPPGSVMVEASGVVGAFEYTVISVAAGVADPATPATEWLTENGYDIPPGSTGLIGPYLADGMYLLALRLTKGSTAGSIRPIVLTYAAEAPMIPIKLTAVAANQDMGVMTWALSSARAVPFNYNALELNEARINWFNAALNYGDVVTEAADAAGGQGFVTEYAGPSSQLADVVWPSFEEQNWQQMKTSQYATLQDLYSTLEGFYSGASGFSDAVRRTVTLSGQVSIEDFLTCSSCYFDQVEFSPAALLAAVEQDVIEPMRAVQELIDRAPYATRLYSTLSAPEMTVDPVFVFNADLPEVNNIHQATRVTECDPTVYEWEAAWRIELPQGGMIRGTADSVGSWPTAVDAQPPNFRVLTLASAGEGVVVEDNASEINALLDDYNDGVPRPNSDSGLCSLPFGSAPRPAPVAAATLLAVLLGAVRARRAARPR